MSKLIVNIDDRKSEKVVLAVLQALGLSYEMEAPEESIVNVAKPLNKAEQAMYKRLKTAFEEIKLHQEGTIKLKTIEEVLAELS
ncbi:hypothetical protein [Olivibacter sitiensis]|uniref:hypothetical protein n=1 Tax=Olivibacter sitiensis TaxID=376470 RepID=UPI0004060709|nr:hypothetical protein [Olivibacter sitiensis]